MKDGAYAGMNCVQLQSDHAGQKNNDLSLGNTTCDNDDNYEYLPFPQTDDPLCVYNLLYRQIFEFTPPNCSDSRIFRRIATQKQLKVRHTLNYIF